MPKVIEKLKPTNKFVIDNSPFIFICEAEFEKEENSEDVKLTFVRTIEKFDTIEEAESYADLHGIPIWVRTKNWFSAGSTIVVKGKEKVVSI